jgi:hypothetical protein
MLQLIEQRPMLPQRSNHAASRSRVSEPESQANAGDAPRIKMP